MDVQEDDHSESAKVLQEMKSRGFKRKTPQAESTPNNIKVKEKQFLCAKCGFTGSSYLHLERHTSLMHRRIGMSVKEDEFNCKECDFQGSEEIHLGKHIKIKHTIQASHSQGTITCKVCGEKFSEKWNLMVHRKTSHIGSVAMCRNFKDGSCNYTDDACWWNHEDKVNHKGNIQCFLCGKTFERKSEMMSHRKINHSDILQQCNQFLKGSCRFQNQYCWFKHSLESKENDKSDGVIEEEKEIETPSVFQKVVKNPKPPSGLEKSNEKTQN